MNIRTITIYSLAYKRQHGGIACRVFTSKAEHNLCQAGILRENNPGEAVASLLAQGRVDDAWSHWLAIDPNAAGNSTCEQTEIPIPASEGSMTLRQQFASQAPAIPDWFEQAPAPPPELNAPQKSWAEEQKAKADKIVQLRARRMGHFTSWAYTYADAMLTQEPKLVVPPA